MIMNPRKTAIPVILFAIAIIIAASPGLALAYGIAFLWRGRSNRPV